MSLVTGRAKVEPDVDEKRWEESWDDYIDNWTEFCKELKGKLPKVQSLRRRQLAAKKLRILVAKLDSEFERAILQLGETDMDGYIAGGGEDAWTGFLSTARRLGKKPPKKDGGNHKLTNATARVQHMERSREMVSIFKGIVDSHDAQLRGAILALTKQQMDRIVRKNHEKFSGTHKQRERGRGNGSSGQAAKTLDHQFVTPRVKSAAKSRQAVSLLNHVVDEKDGLLKNAIEKLERKEKNQLTSKNNDFLKFEAQRAKQREEFRQAKNTKAAAEHPHATKRVRQEARAKKTLEELKETGRKRSKALAISVKRISKSQRDSFVRKVNGVPKNTVLSADKASPLSVPRKLNEKNLDTARYARAEVMAVSRRVKADVQRAVQFKDDELGKIVASMDEEELRILSDCGPNGMEGINLWKRDRRKRAWRRLSAFGMVRNDPERLRRWKQHRHQQRASETAVDKSDTEEGEMLGMCATDAARRPPWSTDLHYTHRCRAQEAQLTPHLEEETEDGKDTRALGGERRTIRAISSPRRISGKCPHTAPSSRSLANMATPVRPASAPRGHGEGFVRGPPHNQLDAARTPSLARLARVFYESSVSRTTAVPGESSNERRHAEQAGAFGCSAQASPENEQHDAVPGQEARKRQGYQRGSHDNSDDLGGVEKRMESARLLWAVSQLSTEAVTKKIMHGYSERQHAREPNRKPQPPTNRCNGGRRRRRNSSPARHFMG